MIIVQLTDLTSATCAAETVNKSREAKASPEGCQMGIVATETTPCTPQVQRVSFHFLWSEKGGIPPLKNEKPLSNKEGNNLDICPTFSLDTGLSNPMGY